VNNLFEYTTGLTTDVLTMVGKLGVPWSYVRLYGFGGATWSRAHWDTLENIDDQTVTVDGVETTVPGGMQVLDLYTQGWGWVAGGGMEIPLSKRVMIFTEGGRAGIKGDDRQGGEGKIDDRVLYIVAGLRIRIIG
jgi:opacity protein-like surface antigen